MLGFIEFIRKRPSDKFIRIFNILFGFFYIFSVYYNFFWQENLNNLESVFFWQELDDSSLQYIKYFLFSLGILPLIMGLFDLCIARKKIVRIIQSIIGILILYFSFKIVRGSSLDVDTIFFLMGFFYLIAGISGKLVSSKCLRYNEKIKKIRI